MTANAPQSLAAEITDGINALIKASDSYRSPNAPEVRSLVDAIRKLQQVDRTEYIIRSASIAAICGDVDDLYKVEQQATAESLDSPYVKQELWINFTNAAAYKRAYEIGLELLQPQLGFFRSLWRRAVSLGYIHAVSDQLARAQKMYPRQMAEENFSLLESVAEVANQWKLADADTISVFDLVGEIQRKHGVMFNGEGPDLTIVRPPEDEPYLHYAVRVDVPIEEVRAMNRELARSMVQRLPYGTYPSGLVASFRKSDVEKARAAA